MDLFKFFDELKKKYPAQNELSRPLFVAIFIPVRLVYWPYVCSEFWMDSIAELQAAQPRQPVQVVATFLVANILLTGLQFFWGTLIDSAITLIVFEISVGLFIWSQKKGAPKPTGKQEAFAIFEMQKGADMLGGQMWYPACRQTNKGSGRWKQWEHPLLLNDSFRPEFI